MYKHTQIGWVTIISLSIGLIACAVLYIFIPASSGNSIYLSVIVVIALLIPLFGSLTVTVDQKEVVAKFGIGLIKKRIPLSKIESCETVRNKWWYGWGLRLTPGGWMFNVHGLDAVTIMRKNGKAFRIGTDEPEKLCEFINRRIEK